MDIDNLIKDFSAVNLSTKEIKEKYNISSENLRDIIRKYSLVRPSAIRQTKEDDEIEYIRKKRNLCYIDAQELKDLLSQGMTQKECSNYFDVSLSKISKCVRECGIGRERYSKVNIDCEDFYKYYIVQDLSTRQIGYRFGCHWSTINNKLKLYKEENEEIKKKYENRQNAKKDVNLDQLFYLYVEKGLSVNMCSKILDVSNRMLTGRLRQIGVDVKTILELKEAERIREGRKRVNKYPTEWIKKRSEILIRDKHMCQICMTTKQKDGYSLSVHHIDYNKYNLDERNLITLCRRCHTKTNTNRNFWQAFFTDLISDFYSKKRLV